MGGKTRGYNVTQDISDQSKFIHEQSVTPELSLWASSFPYRGNEGRKALHAISKLMANGFCYCGASRWPTDAFSVNEFPTDRIVFMYRATHSCLVLQSLMWTEFFYEFVRNSWPWNRRVFEFNCKCTNYTINETQKKLPRSLKKKIDEWKSANPSEMQQNLCSYASSKWLIRNIISVNMRKYFYADQLNIKCVYKQQKLESQRNTATGRLNTSSQFTTG